ncbi:MAG: Short-chain dehydrogenase/reductase [Bacteroidetes bacterium]|nr:Short-chain dehydrogenase/reductase [Bacteroidota bacterium]
MKQVILITGASSGIGMSAARLLAKDGHIVYAAARRTDRMKELEADGIKLLSMDVTDDASMQAGVKTILDREKRIDALVNNAGYGSYGALEDVPISEAKYQFEVNVFGLARLTQLVLPQMRAQKSGKIINISSIGGKVGEPHGAWYHATKFAVEGLSDSLRMELKEFGIDVVVIQPGAIKTEWAEIARKKMLETSGTGAYKELTIKHAKMFEMADKQGDEPIVIGRAIKKAVEARKPKTRYTTGGGAKPALFLRKILSDRAFDSFMLMMINRMGK